MKGLGLKAGKKGKEGLGAADRLGYKKDVDMKRKNWKNKTTGVDLDS